MIEQPAVVVAAGEGEVWVETQRRSACGSCSTNSGCGAAALARHWEGRSSRVRAVCALPLQPGDAVVLGLAEGSLLRGSLLVYLLPIGLLLAGAVLGQTAFAGAGEEPVILAGAVGLALGFLAARFVARRLRHDVRYQPVVLRRLAPASGAATLPSCGG